MERSHHLVLRSKLTILATISVTHARVAQQQRVVAAFALLPIIVALVHGRITMVGHAG